MKVRGESVTPAYTSCWGRGLIELGAKDQRQWWDNRYALLGHYRLISLGHQVSSKQFLSSADPIIPLDAQTI